MSTPCKLQTVLSLLLVLLLVSLGGAQAAAPLRQGPGRGATRVEFASSRAGNYELYAYRAQEP